MDIDGVTGRDNPWNFGANDQYPVLQYDGMDTTTQFNRQPTLGTLSALSVAPTTLSPDFETAALAYTAALPNGSAAPAVTVAAVPTATTTGVAISAVAGSVAAGHQVVLSATGTVITITVAPQVGVTQSYVVTLTNLSANDYDDDNGLIDVRTLAQLNAIRYDLNGDGAADRPPAAPRPMPPATSTPPQVWVARSPTTTATPTPPTSPPAPATNCGPTWTLTPTAAATTAPTRPIPTGRPSEPARRRSAVRCRATGIPSPT